MSSINNRVTTPRASFGRASAGRPAPKFPQTSPRSAPRPAPQIEVPQRALNTGQIAKRSFGPIRRNAVTFLALVSAAAVPERLAYHLMGDNDFMMLTLMLLTALPCVPLYGAIASATMADIRGEKVSFGASIRAGVRASIFAFAPS